jgi:PAS domain S-box-containing protein
MSFRNSPGWTSVQTRLTLVMVAAAVLAALTLYLSQASEPGKTDAFLTADAREHGELLDRALELEGSQLMLFANHYANWDEMVQFVRTGDRAWASQNLTEALRTYRADAAWVFGPTGSLVDAVRGSALATLIEPMPSGLSVRAVFGNDRLCHVFIAGPDGPVEIRGATIHPSDDPERKTPVRGYFLVARAWSRPYLAELTRLTGKTLRIGPARGGAEPTTEINRSTGEITLTRPLPDPRGKPEMMLTASLQPRWRSLAQRSDRRSFELQASLALLALLGLWLLLRFWVTRPLELLRRSLASGSITALKPLGRNRTELGQLAQLVEQYFGQNAALVKEVAERKRTEQTLRENEEKYRLVVNNVSEAILVAQDWKIVFANPSASRILGYRHEQLLGLSFNEFIHYDDRWPVADGYRRRLAGEDIRERFGFRVLPRYGEPRHVEVSAVHIDWMGRPATLSFLADVTERKHAENALRESEEQFRRAFEDSGVGKLLTERDGSLPRVNRAFAAMLGQKVEELQSMDFQAITHPDDVAESAEVMARLQTETGGSARLEKRYLHKNGSVVWVDMSTVLLRDVAGRPHHFVSDVVNITERKRAEEEIKRKNAQLVELNKEKNQLLGMAAHDLRNPLSIVNTASAFLLDDASRLLPEAKRAEFLRRINSGSKFMLNLIDDLLDVTKIEAGRLDLELKDGDLCGLIEENLALNRMLANKKNIRLDFAPESGLPRLRFDRGKVEQVLNNLVSNALKFSASGTVVTVRASRVDGNMVVSVRDQGQGIPAEELDKLFKPFGKTSVRGTAGEKSTGLGLAICRKIIEGHGGRIWAESELGKGSVFSFSLPVAAPARAHDGLRTLDYEPRTVARDVLVNVPPQAAADDILATMPDALLLLGPDGGFVRANRAALDLFGYGVGELNDKNAELLFAEPAVFRAALARISGGDPASAQEIDGRTRDGLVVPVSLSGRLMRGHDGDTVGVVLVLRDVTERKRAEEELTRTQAEVVTREKLATLGRVAGSMAHELRNPLGAIRNATYFLKLTASQKLTGRASSHLDIINEEITRANRIITSVVDFAQGRPSLPRPCRLADILSRATARAQLPRTVEVESRVPEDLPLVNVDPEQMEPVFLNIINNAHQAMPDGGRIGIVASHSDGVARVAVSDSGSGIAPEHMARLFEPLFSTKVFGVGLGLAICKAFIEANKGTVSVETEVGRGTTVTVTLPTAEGQAPDPGPPGP